MDLRFAVDGEGRTYLAKRAHRYPLHFTVPLYIDEHRPDMPFIYMQNPSGGVFAGDHLRINVVAEEGAHVHLTTPSATKIYRMEAGKAVQEARIRLHRGAYLEYMPEPLIPQAGSRFEQEMVFHVEDGASFVATETLAPGRLARGEIFEYDRLLLRTKVRDSCGDLCADVLLLEPRNQFPKQRGILGSYAYFATLLAVAPHLDAEELADVLHNRVKDIPATLAAAGALPSGSGALVRVLAYSSIAASQALEAAWHTTRQILLGYPPPRRRK